MCSANSDPAGVLQNVWCVYYHHISKSGTFPKTGCSSGGAADGLYSVSFVKGRWEGARLTWEPKSAVTV